MARGGKRKGAGRPKGTGKFGEPTKAVRLPISMIDRIMGFIERKGLAYPLCSSDDRAGDAADEGANERFDLLGHLVPNPSSTFFVRMAGDAMSGTGIYSDDLLIVDKSLEPKSGDIIVAVVDGKLTVRRFIVKNKKIELKPENSKFSTIKIAAANELNIRGVVKNVVHSV